MDADIAKEKQIPIILIVIGLIIWVIVGFARFDVGPLWIVLIVGIDATVRTLLLIAAAYVTAGLMSVSFGDLRAAFLKFTAVVVFSGAVGAAIPFGGIIAAVVAFGLLLWLFDLEVYQAVVFTIIYWVVSLVAGIIVAGLLRSL